MANEGAARSRPQPKDWREQLKTDPLGYLASAANYGIVLREDENLAGLFALDRRSQRIRIWARIPFDDFWLRGHERWFNRDDLTLVAEYLERQGFAPTDRRALYFAIRAVSRDYSTYLDGDRDGG